MAKVKAVTGFSPLPGYPRAKDKFLAYGDRLGEALDWNHFEYVFGPIEDFWLYRWLGDKRGTVTHSVADNPQKNTLEYHCVQHEKFRWLSRAFKDDWGYADIYVWIDYGIFHLPGMNETVIQDYMRRLDNTKEILIPGCWHRDENISQDFPCWRFCGGLMAVPASLVEYFSQLCRVTAMEHIMKTNNVEWEVNTLARVELLNKLPIRHYFADHNETMFTNLP